MTEIQLSNSLVVSIIVNVLFLLLVIFIVRQANKRAKQLQKDIINYVGRINILSESERRLQNTNTEIGGMYERLEKEKKDLLKSTETEIFKAKEDSRLFEEEITILKGVVEELEAEKTQLQKDHETTLKSYYPKSDLKEYLKQAMAAGKAKENFAQWYSEFKKNI